MITYKKALAFTGGVCFMLAAPVESGFVFPGGEDKDTVPNMRHLAGCSAPAKIDFSGLTRGEYVSANEYASLGVKFLASGGFNNKPRVFDTSRPGTYEYGDPDLGSPNKACTPSGPGVGSGGEPGEPGENCKAQGNVVIIEESGGDDPDDNASGGKIVMKFDPPAQYVYEMGFLDIDSKAYLEIYGAAGGKDTIYLSNFGDNSFQFIDIDLGNIARIELILERSGALSYVEFCPGVPQATEEPQTTDEPQTTEGPQTTDEPQTTEPPFECGAGGPNPPPGQNCGQYQIIPSRDENYNVVEIINGKTYSDLVGGWTYWALDRPSNADWPFVDDDGSKNQVDSGIDGVHFLAGTGGGTACREVTISKNDILFLPIASKSTFSFPSDTEEGWYTPKLRFTASYFGVKDPLSLSFEEITDTRVAADLLSAKTRDLDLYVNGCKLDASCDYAIAYSLLFQDGAAIVEGGVFEAGSFGATAGYFVALAPLPVGEHMVRFSAIINKERFAIDPSNYSDEDFSLDVEYKVKVH